MFLSAHLHVCDDLLEEAAEGRALLVHGRQVHRGDGEGHGGGGGGVGRGGVFFEIGER